MKSYGRESKEPDKEIPDSHSVYSGQILAEMFAAISYPEYYKQSDQEVQTISVQRADIRHS